MTHKIGVIIDGNFIFSAARSLGFRIDYIELKKYIEGFGFPWRLNYHTTEKEAEEFNQQRPLQDWLTYNGFEVITRIYRERSGEYQRRPSVNVNIAVDAMAMADHVDEIFLFSGDGELTPVVDAIRRKGVRAVVLASMETTPSMVADDLRRAADEFIDLAKIRDKIAKPNDAADMDDARRTVRRGSHAPQRELEDVD